MYMLNLKINKNQNKKERRQKDFHTFFKTTLLRKTWKRFENFPHTRSLFSRNFFLHI